MFVEAVVAGKGDLPGARERALFQHSGNELSEETHMLTEQETVLGKGAGRAQQG